MITKSKGQKLKAQPAARPASMDISGEVLRQSDKRAFTRAMREYYGDPAYFGRSAAVPKGGERGGNDVYPMLDRPLVQTQKGGMSVDQYRIRERANQLRDAEEGGNPIPETILDPREQFRRAYAARRAPNKLTPYGLPSRPMSERNRYPDTPPLKMTRFGRVTQ